MELKVGAKAPDFKMKDINEKEVSLVKYKGKYLVLYFYPKDNTSGCTTESIDFTDKLKFFSENNAVVVGVSPDSVKSHCNFIAKHNLKVELLSDEEKLALQSYGVWQEKSMYGRKYFGVVRTTVLISPDQKILKVWSKVKVAGHVDAVIEELKNNL